MQHQNKSNENYFKLEKRRRISLKGTAKLISSLAFIFQAGRILLATLTITIISGRDSSTRNRELYLTVSRNSIVYLKRCFACVKVREKSQLSDSCSFTNLLYRSLKCHEGALFERINSILERRRSVGNIYFWKVWTIYWLNAEYI